jgi:hypothetical protein
MYWDNNHLKNGMAVVDLKISHVLHPKATHRLLESVGIRKSPAFLEISWGYWDTHDVLENIGGHGD